MMSFGVMGGPMQPQGHVQVVARIVDHGRQPAKAACDGPRFRRRPTTLLRGGFSAVLDAGPARAAAISWSPPTTTTSSGSCQAICGSTMDILRSATLAAMVRRRVSSAFDTALIILFE